MRRNGLKQRKMLPVKFPDFVTGELPYFDSNESKVRTLFVLGANVQRGTVLVAKVTSSDPRIVYAGQFAIYSADRFFKSTGLNRDSKVDLNACYQLPIEKVIKKIGTLVLTQEKDLKRLMAAIMNSTNSQQIFDVSLGLG